MPVGQSWFLVVFLGLGFGWLSCYLPSLHRGWLAASATIAPYEQTHACTKGVDSCIAGSLFCRACPIIWASQSPHVRRFFACLSGTSTGIRERDRHPDHHNERTLAGRWPRHDRFSVGAGSAGRCSDHEPRGT